MQAMGNYPYPTAYITNGAGILPAFPMRTACSHLADPHLNSSELLQGLAKAAGVFYNHSGHLECLEWAPASSPTAQADMDLYGFQLCSEQFTPISHDGGGERPRDPL